MNKKAQEEMVGFAFIIIIVAVILIIFVSLAMNKPEEQPESYEVDSFIQALLQSTTDCEDRFEHLTVQRLISRCSDNSVCIDGRSTCDVLEEDLSEIFGKIWQIEDRPVEGYVFNITSQGDEIFSIVDGNKTNSFKGSIQILPDELNILFNVYY